MLVLHARAIPYETENKAQLQKRKITQMDLLEDVCGTKPTESCAQCDGKKACPFNVAQFESVPEPDYDNGRAHDDQNTKAPEYITSVVSTVGNVPAVVIGYQRNGSAYDDAAADVATPFWKTVKYNYNVQQQKSGVMEVLFTSFGAKADMGATWSSVGLQFEELLQYKDNNYDGKYTASVDTPVKRVKFASAFKWKKLVSSLNKTDSSSVADGYAFTMETTDGTASIRFETSDEVDLPQGKIGAMGAPRLRTGNATRVVLNLKDLGKIFKYKEGEDDLTRLAIKVVVGSDGDDAFPQLSDHIAIDDRASHAFKGYFTWTPSAWAKSLAGPFANSEREERIRMSQLGLCESSEVSYSIAKAGMGAPRCSYFSIGGSAYNVDSASWDVAIGIGQQPIRATWSYWPIFVFGMVVFLLAVAFAANGCKLTRENTTEEDEFMVQQDEGAPLMETGP
jgi:hypothetical protein